MSNVGSGCTDGIFVQFRIVCVQFAAVNVTCAESHHMHMPTRRVRVDVVEEEEVEEMEKEKRRRRRSGCSNHNVLLRL